MVAQYVRRARLFRIWGGVVGVLMPTVIDLVVNHRVEVLGFGTDGQNAPLAFGSIFVGYLVGALCAEVSLARPRPGPRRTALLARRELEAYLPRRVIVAQRAAAVIGAAGALAIAATPYPATVTDPGIVGPAVSAALILAFGAGLEAIERWFVRRPQPFTEAALVAADDAIRAQSIRAVAGAGLALQLLVCGGVALVLQASDVAILGSAMVAPAVACLVLALLACSGITHGTWRVRRPIRPTRAVSA
jgi:hypothetical protein